MRMNKTLINILILPFEQKKHNQLLQGHNFIIWEATTHHKHIQFLYRNWVYEKHLSSLWRFILSSILAFDLLNFLQIYCKTVYILARKNA